MKLMSTHQVSPETPYASLFWDMIEAAHCLEASDIHIQPESVGVKIRFRIYGEMSDWKTIPVEHRQGFLQEAKRLSQCSMAVSGKAQDSRISIPEYSLDLRVSLVPTLHGEKVVLRLLKQNQSFRLESLGLEHNAIKAIHKALSLKTGVVILTGPTGSGKTTTLYSALSALNQEILNIITVEDPIEYTFPGISQIQVGARISFADALRAILRQDPDVILLGEIRDPETASLCFQAASTGHLVLTTLHTNSAREVYSRLMTLGVSADLVQTCLRFSSGQRLLPRLCSSCRIPPRDVTCAIFSRNLTGCPQCRRGVKGRILILEFIEWFASSSGVASKSSPTLKEIALAHSQKGNIDEVEVHSLG